MAGSAWYYAQYLEHLGLADKYQKWAEYLEEVLDMLQRKYDDNISDINNDITKLKDQLSEAVINNSVYDDHVEDLTKKKEKEVESDEKLGSAISSLRSEIGRLDELVRKEKREAQDDYESYLQALREEQEAARRASEALSSF